MCYWDEDGKLELCSREKQVLAAKEKVEGCGPEVIREIARNLDISINTVRQMLDNLAHVKHVMNDRPRTGRIGRKY